MWDESKCDRCGDCFTDCLYVDWDRDKAMAEISRLVETGESEILRACVTCCGCNEFCEKGADPWDLILKRQEETGCLTILPKPPAMFELAASLPSSVEKGEPGRPAISLCVMEHMSRDLLQGRIFQGLTVIKGGDYFCRIGYLHIGREAPVREHARRVVETLAATGEKEIVCFHEDCYALLSGIAPGYGIPVPFRPVHFFEFLHSALKEHEKEVRKLNLSVAYQRPCASRYSGDKDPLLDEIFRRIGVTRVDREYDRKTALCCGGPLLARGDRDGALALANRNLEDAVKHGAQYLAYLCPMCSQTLRFSCELIGLSRIGVSDLCRMALGEAVNL
jgi:hypothetical protein